MKEILSILERIKLAQRGQRAVLATLVSVQGSSFRRPGARMLVEAGERLGAISGGCLEADICERAILVAQSGKAEVAAYDTTVDHDLFWGVGTGCGGVIRVLIEPLAPCPAWAAELAVNLARRRPTELAVVWECPDPTRLGTYLARALPDLPADSAVFRQLIAPAPALVIFGAGDDAQALVRAAKELGWHVTVADARAEFATSRRFPEADSLVVGNLDELVARTSPPPESLAIVMTHRYSHDLPILRELLPRPLAYLGLLGPKKRSERILANLGNEAEPPTVEQRERLHSPVGLDVGGETPEEIALSAMAEMLAVLSGKDARPLREKEGAIHA